MAEYRRLATILGLAASRSTTLTIWMNPTNACAWGPATCTCHSKPCHRLFSGYSNMGWAYLPTPEAYPLGGYEVEMTPFAPEAAGLIVADCLSLLRELAG